MGMKIGKTYRFEAAHHLPGHKGKCARPHGHSYKLEVEIEGGLIAEPGASDEHMVEDFETLDSLVRSIIDELDHTDLNVSALSLLGCTRTTAEGLVLAIAGLLYHNMDLGSAHIYKKVQRAFGGEPKLSRVRLYETENCYAEWTA